MKSLIFNKNSIHYKLAEFGGLSKWSQYDICSYTQRVILGVLQTCVLGAIFALFAHLVVNMFLGVGFSLWYWRYMFTEAGEIGGIFTIIGLAFALIFFGIPMAYRACKDRLTQRKGIKPPQPDGFIKAAYKSHKEKYCVRVTFE